MVNQIILKRNSLIKELNKKISNVKNQKIPGDVKKFIINSIESQIDFLKRIK